MAQITNDEKVVDRKKDLYNHASFNDLYAYNGPIMSLIQLSQKPFYTVGADAISRFNARALGDRDIVHIPLELRKNAEEGSPTEVLFTEMNIVDPIDGTELSSEDYTKLKEFTDLGLYPLICTPLTFSAALNGFEKYDNCGEDRQAIGTIIDLVRRDNTYKAIVMWDPQFGAESDTVILAPDRGYISIADMVPTPAIWKSENGSPITDIGVPYFQFVPASILLNTINSADGLVDFINQAVVTNHLELDFVKDLMNKSVQTLTSVAASIEKDIKSEKPPVPTHSVPVEDASVSDEFGHKLHLYDSEYPVVPDEDEPEFELG